MSLLSKIMAIIEKVMGEKFWGEVVIKFKDGKPVMVTTTTQTKLD